MDSPQTCEVEGFYVDVGEEDHFYVEIQGATQYNLLHQTEASLVVRVTLQDGDVICSRINWSTKKKGADSRGRYASDLCSDVVRTPRVISRQLYVFGRTFVMVVLREFIEGTPANLLWDHMSSEQRDYLAEQVSRAVVRISKHKHEYYGYMRGTGLRSRSASSYLNHQIVLSKITNRVGSHDIHLMEDSTKPHEATMCHGNLVLEHVIVKAGQMVGLVGWGSADYVPEIYDRARYYSLSDPLAPDSWELRMATTPISNGTPDFRVACCSFELCFALRLRSSPVGECRIILDWRDVLRSDPLALSGTGMVGTALQRFSEKQSLGSRRGSGDRRSLDLHTKNDSRASTELPESVCSYDFDEVCTTVLDMCTETSTVKDVWN